MVSGASSRRRPDRSSAASGFTIRRSHGPASTSAGCFIALDGATALRRRRRQRRWGGPGHTRRSTVSSASLLPVIFGRSGLPRRSVNASSAPTWIPCMENRCMSTQSPAPEPAVTVDGVRSPLTDLGPRTSEAVVFVHGNPGSRLDWSELAAATSRFARTVAMDMPGYGHADKPADFDYTVAGYARHLAGALDQLGISRVHLV